MPIPAELIAHRHPVQALLHSRKHGQDDGKGSTRVSSRWALLLPQEAQGFGDTALAEGGQVISFSFEKPGQSWLIG